MDLTLINSYKWAISICCFPIFFSDLHGPVKKLPAGAPVLGDKLLRRVDWTANSGALELSDRTRGQVTMGQRNSRTWESAKFELMGKAIEIMIQPENPWFPKFELFSWLKSMGFPNESMGALAVPIFVGWTSTNPSSPPLVVLRCLAVEWTLTAG